MRAKRFPRIGSSAFVRFLSSAAVLTAALCAAPVLAQLPTALAEIRGIAATLTSSGLRTRRGMEWRLESGARVAKMSRPTAARENRLIRAATLVIRSHPEP